MENNRELLERKTSCSAFGVQLLMSAFNQSNKTDSLKLLKKKICNKKSTTKEKVTISNVETKEQNQPELKFYTKPAIKWTNPEGKKCIPIRGESRCLCGCRKKVHKWNEDSQSFQCSKQGCKCKSFFFIVAEGAWKLRCGCKHHASPDHDPSPGKHKCTKPNCKCNGFVSPWFCNCGSKWSEHRQETEHIKFVSVDGSEMPASMFAQMMGVEEGDGIAPEINNVARDPKFGKELY